MTRFREAKPACEAQEGTRAAVRIAYVRSILAPGAWPDVGGIKRDPAGSELCWLLAQVIDTSLVACYTGVMPTVVGCGAAVYIVAPSTYGRSTVISNRRSHCAVRRVTFVVCCVHTGCSFAKSRRLGRCRPHKRQA